MEGAAKTRRVIRVRVDGRKCQGHNRCVLAAPQVFQPDEYGYSQVQMDEIPPELDEPVRLAVRNCPERAIFIEEEA